MIVKIITLLFLVLLVTAIGHHVYAQQPVLSQAPLKAVPVFPDTMVRASLVDITDSRTTGKFSQYMRLNIALTGQAVRTVFGVSRPTITEAVDDVGSDLLKEEEENRPLFWILEKNERKKTSLENFADFLNPARRATSFSAAGYIDMLDPAKDPASVYTVKGFIALAGTSLLPPELKESGAEISVLTKPLADKLKQERALEEQKKAAAKPDRALQEAIGGLFKGLFSGFFTMGENDLLFVIKDPQKQVAFIEVVDENGAPIKTGGSRSIVLDKESGAYRYSVSYDAAIPQTAQLRIYLATPKSLTRVPFKFESVPLP